MCVGVNVPATVDVSSSAPSRAQERQQHEARSLGHRLHHTTGPTRPHPFRTHATHSYDVGKSPTSFTERPGHRNGSERVWGARPCSLVLVLTRITCPAASCSVRGRMRGDQAQGRGAILGSQQQPQSPGRRMALNLPTRHAHRTCEMPLKPGRKGREKKSYRHQPRVSGRGYLSYPRTHVEIPAVGGVLGTDKHDFRPCVKVSLTGFLRP